MNSFRSSRGVPSIPLTHHANHIFFPFFGGPSDRTALRFVLQLAQNPYVTATISFMDIKQDSEPDTAEDVQI